MSTLGTNAVTLQDLRQGMDPNGAPAQVIEILNQDAPILEDMAWVEGNLPTGHQHTVRTGLPTPAWRLLNYGVPATKGTTVSVTDTCGMLEDYSQIDKRLLALNGHSAGWRMQQDKPHIEGMYQTLASTIFYGNTATDPEKFLGLAPRFNSTSTATAQTAENVITGGGSGSDNTSVWLVGWSNSTVFGIYPKGTSAGLSVEDLGEETAVDSGGRMYQVMRTHFSWDCGLGVPDWRYVVRICNIDVSDLTKNAGSGADLVDLMVQAAERIQSLQGVRPAFYCNRRVTSFLRRQLSNRTNAHLAYDEAGGKRVLSFDEIPVRRCDAIINTEATVS